MSKPRPILSDNAKVVAGAWFGIAPGIKVVHHMLETRPTAECQAALDELVNAGIIFRLSSNKSPAVVYEALEDCTPYTKWLRKHINSGAAAFQLMERIDTDPAL